MGSRNRVAETEADSRRIAYAKGGLARLFLDEDFSDALNVADEAAKLVQQNNIKRA
jgi:hypothetical protein